MAFIRSYFRVEVVNTGFTANEFYDVQPVWRMDTFSTEPGNENVPSSLAASERKSRSFYRWNRFLQMISDNNLVYLGSIDDEVNTAPTIDNPPDEIHFTVGFEHDEDAPAFTTYDWTVEGGTDGEILMGTDAIVRVVARPLSLRFESPREIFDPTVGPGPGFTFIRNLVVEPTAAGANTAERIADAEGNITITYIEDVE